MPKAKAYVMKKLMEYGLEPKELGEGITAALGRGGQGDTSQSLYGRATNA